MILVKNYRIFYSYISILYGYLLRIES